MIPSVLLSTEKSSAEARVIEVLADADLGEHWLALHSLNCSEHAYKRWAEIDFLIVGPDAILVIEVKGGRVQCSDGIWTYTDRFGRSRSSSEGPFGQARSAMYALHKLLSHRYQLSSVVSGKTCFGFGVMFPDIDWDVDTPEAPVAITADRTMLTSGKAVARYLHSLTRYWQAKTPRSTKLDPSEIRELRNRLRPDVDVYPPFSQRVGLALREMQHLTEEQYERLEILEQNDRAIVSGGAGTGKTFLLVQLARRQAALGRSVNVVVHSPILAEHIRNCIADSRICVHTLQTVPAATPADLVLVDEGQDLMTFDALSTISATIRGGLDRGHWCWFMDENNQSGLAGEFDPEALEYLSHGLTTGKPFRVPLRRNCRNTKEIVNQVQLWTGANIGVTDVSGRGAKPQVVVVKNDDAPLALEQLVSHVLDGGAAPEEIGIITPAPSTPAAFVRLSTRIKRLLTPLTTATVASNLSGRILWGPPAAFKGLERPIVFVLACESDALASGPPLYVAATRANYGLWVLVTPKMSARLTAVRSQSLS